MYIDRNLRFLDDTAVTVTADAPLVPDLGIGRDIGISPEVYVVLVVTETFLAAGAATLDVILTTDDNATLTSDTDVQTLLSAIGKATLVQGYKRAFRVQPGIVWERYAGVRFVVATGPFTAGKATIFLTTQPELYRQYADPL